MKLIFAISFVLLATGVYGNPSMQVEDNDEVEAFTEEQPVQLDEAVNDDDDDEEADDEDVEEDNDDDFDGDNKKNCSRTLRKELKRCLNIDCRLQGLLATCLRAVIFRCQPDEVTKKCIYKLPACMSKFCKADDRKLGKPGRRCMRRFRKCVKKSEGSGMELELL